MSPILLPLSALHEYDACELDERIIEFDNHHGMEPTETTTLREWLEVTPDMDDVLWATQCLGRAGRILGLEVATKAARRALAAVGWDHGADPRPLAAVEAAEAILAEWLAEREPTAEMRQAAHAAYIATAHTSYAASVAANTAYTATYVVDIQTARLAAFNVAHVAHCVAHSAANSTAERAAQRADFLAVLDLLESGR